MPTLAVIVPELLPVPAVKGGAVEHWVEEAINRLDHKKYEITVFSRPSGLESVNANIRFQGIPWTALESRVLKWKNGMSWKNPLRYFAKFQNVISYGNRVAASVKNFDIVYVHNEPNLFLLMQKKVGQYFVLHMHNDHLSSRLFRPIYRKMLAKVDEVICVSEYIKQRAVLAFPEFKHKFSVILNATDPELFQPAAQLAVNAQPMPYIKPGAKHILYVGRLTEVKGVEVLIKAFGHLYKQDPSLQLIIAGTSFFADAEKTPYVQHLADLAVPYKDGIQFTGFLPHDQLKHLYAATDVLAFPSIWNEPFGLVILESMAAGTCVVASDVGAVAEIIQHEENGLLVEVNNHIALANAIQDVLGNTEKRQTMTKRAREIVLEKFNWGRLIAELDMILGKAR